VKNTARYVRRFSIQHRVSFILLTAKIDRYLQIYNVLLHGSHLWKTAAAAAAAVVAAGLIVFHLFIASEYQQWVTLYSAETKV